MTRRFAWLLISMATAAHAEQVRPGVWAGADITALPLPAKGHEVYLAGELHGIQENAAFQLAYLDKLRREAGLRDVAMEEDGVYEEEARAYIEGRAASVPPALCLRAGLLDGLRERNRTLAPSLRIRIHLVDIDSPAEAIALDLGRLAVRLGADARAMPGAGEVRERGLDAVAALRRHAREGTPEWSRLRTVERSVTCLQEGLSVGLGRNQGSPYLECREQTIADNIIDLVRARRAAPLLVAYGADHVTRKPRRDGGRDRNQPFDPMALRLQRAGIRAFAVAAFPLAGVSWWRGSRYEFPWSAEDGRLSTGETFATLLAADSTRAMIYLDQRIERAKLPTQDMNAMDTDAIVLFRAGTPQANRCSAR